MKDLYTTIREIASFTDEAILMFSTGKDSIVCLDLCRKYGIKVQPVYLYKVQGISFREQIIKYYENRFDVRVAQHPAIELINYQNNNRIDGKKEKKLRAVDLESYLRRKYNMSWIIQGVKASDGFGCKLMVHTGCLPKHKKGYPVAHWTDKDVYNYIKKNKLPLPLDYKIGYENIDTYKGELLLYVYQNHPEDYQKIKSQYPLIEGELVRMGVL